MTARSVTALLLAVCTTAPLAHAQDAQKGIRVGADYAATIAAESERLGYGMAAACGYVAVLTPNNRFQIAFGGSATTWGTQVAQVTYVKCSIEDGQGGSDFTEFVNGGWVSYVAKTASAWRYVPAHVCVEGFAVFGPTPVVIVTLERTCETDLSR